MKWAKHPFGLAIFLDECSQSPHHTAPIKQPHILTMFPIHTPYNMLSCRINTVLSPWCKFMAPRLIVHDFCRKNVSCRKMTYVSGNLCTECNPNVIQFRFNAITSKRKTCLFARSRYCVTEAEFNYFFLEKEKGLFSKIWREF